MTLQFSGAVTQVPLDEVFGDIAFGDPIQGFYSFDTSALDLIPGDPKTASFTWSAPFGMTANIGSHVFNASGLLNIGVLNSFVDQYTVFAQNSTGDLTLELFFQDNTGAAFTNDQLPLSASALSGFSQGTFKLDAALPGGLVQIDGQLAPFDEQVVPEPATTGLLVAASAIVIWTRRKRRA